MFGSVATNLHWGWVPAVITSKDEVDIHGVKMINLTLRDDPHIEATMEPQQRGGRFARSGSMYFADEDPFQVVITVDPEQLKTVDNDHIKLRNLPNSYQLSGEDREAGILASPSTRISEEVVGGVDDLIGLTHLHEPAILHALRLRYDSDIIYTATGPILIAVNPFKSMGLYSEEMMERYRLQGEQGVSAAPKGGNSYATPFKRRGGQKELGTSPRLPPHVYQTADDAYRAMMRGLENSVLMNQPSRQLRRGESQINALTNGNPTNQSILVSGESGAGKTVTTKIVLNYLAMLSKIRAAQVSGTPMKSPQRLDTPNDVSIEQQVLQSNPILESFGNARTLRNDNSSRFGKYIDIRFTSSGKLSGACIETYLLEKVRLIRPSVGERNYHVFYQFLSSATAAERDELYVDNMSYDDFLLLSESGTYDRRDGISDAANHQEMMDAMVSISELLLLSSLWENLTSSLDYDWVLCWYHPIADAIGRCGSLRWKHHFRSVR
jgi:myosin-5